MHDLNPQNPQHDPPVDAGAAANLSALDDDALATEARRECLRDQRQARWIQAEQARRWRAEGRLDVVLKIALVGLLLLAALTSMAVTVTGLAGGDPDILEAGLLALCVVCGGIVYRLRARSLDG